MNFSLNVCFRSFIPQWRASTVRTQIKNLSPRTMICLFFSICRFAHLPFGSYNPPNGVLRIEYIPLQLVHIWEENKEEMSKIPP